MSLNKFCDNKNSEIDKSRPHNKNDDTIATSMNGLLDTVKGKMENSEESSKKPADLSLQSNSHLISSVTSSLADTPGDSGVLCLDSEASEGTSHAFMTHSLVGAEELVCDSQCDVATLSALELSKSTSSSLMSRSDIDNRNTPVIDDIVPELLVEHKTSPVYENLPDVVLKALESETKEQKSSPRSCEPKKSLSEDIVYRRRCRKKSQSGPSSQKKRVSFHEDILNNTRTDNIHIERGFVSYGPDPAYCDRFKMRNNIVADRSSWCASGDTTKYAADVAQQTMSDILTYGDSSTNRSGVFEYCEDPININKEIKNSDNNNSQEQKRKLYGCDSNSSDSNFSCESESSSSDSTSSNSNKTPSPVQRKCDKTQKSYSCDGFDNGGHMTFMRKTYFSEADIDQPHEHPKKPLEVTQNTEIVKSVLKKNRYITTNVVEENKNNSKKVLKILPSKNIIESLKGFYKNFNFNLAPEKGLPETSIELNNVVEALSDLNHNKKLCKSLDSGFQIDDEDDFVEINLNEQTINIANTKETKVSLDPKEGSPRHKLTLNMKPNKSSGNNNESLPPINKYVVNCESTVYEHKGVSYSYVHDTFQTAFDAPKQAFVPLPDPMDESHSVDTSETTPKPMDVDNSSKPSTPRRHFNKTIQDETELKNGVSKHLSSPKKQNVNRYNRRGMIGKDDNSDNCSNTDNSTLKGGEDINEMFMDSPSNQKLTSNKSVLLNRYLKNVYQKKDLELKIRNNKFFQNKLRLEKGFPSIIYPMNKVCDTFRTSAERMSRLIDKEVIENKRLSVRLLTANEPSYFDSFEDNVAIECSEKLRLQIFSYPNETLNRMLKVQSPYNLEDGSWLPLLVFITDYALYVASVELGGTEYELLCRLPHDELDAIAMGPDNQYVQIIDIHGNIACSVVTAESSLGTRLASSLEWSARTSPLRPGRPPAVLPLSMRPVLTSVTTLTFGKELPEVLFYGSACSGESNERMIDAPGTFAPPLEGYLMYRADVKRKFEPCYFLLRAGVLQWGPQSPTSGTVLPHSIALRSAVGVRRREDTVRPHCFEIALSDSRRLLLAAPDDTAASNWLQSLLLHAAQALEKTCTVVPSPAGGVAGGGPPPASLTVVVTSESVLSVRHTLGPAFVSGAAAHLTQCGHDALLKEYMAEMKSDVDILACGSIKNLTAFKIPDSDENWCCLEWSVFEARERGAGLALVFASSAELERFIAAVEMAYCALTSEAFPLSVIDGTNSTCEIAHAKYEAAWAHMLPAQH